MGKLIAIILIIFSAINFILGYNFYLYQNPIKVCEVCKECIESDIKPIISDTPVVLENIESNGQEAEYELKIRDCWLQFNQVEIDILSKQQEIGDKDIYISSLEDNAAACEDYQITINEYVQKLEQEYKEQTNALNNCYLIN